MTKEQASIEAFVADIVTELRPKGTSAAVTLVILAAARAAADMATRDKDGTIDKYEALKIFHAASDLMGSWLLKRGLLMPAPRD